MVRRVLQRVFQNPRYVYLAVSVTILGIAFATWLPNITLIYSVVSSSDVSLISKVLLLLNLIGSLVTNFTLFSATYTVVIAVLFGIYISLLTYLLVHRMQSVRAGGIATGFAGIMSGVFGVGCAACGSLILTSIFTFTASSSALSLLPLGGNEFGILGVALLILAIVITARNIEHPLVCDTSNITK